MNWAEAFQLQTEPAIAIIASVSLFGFMLFL
jgi:hypothetical protein